MKITTRLGILATVLAVLALPACSIGGRSPSGFLTNYQQMNAGYGMADAVSAYVKPGLDLKKYDSVIIEPVTTIVATPGIGSAVKDQIAVYLEEAMHERLGQNFKVVSAAGPGTMRIRTALTDVVENQNLGKPVTTVHTGARVTLAGTLGSAEVAAFLSNVSFEGEIVDSLSGQRLLANTDHRLGNKREASASTSWAGVRSAVGQNIGRLHERLLVLRDR